jgi:putative Mn2+ efflux pump MntP
MIDAIWCALALALDGFFVCAALGLIWGSRGDLRLALAFGACDAAASASRLLLGAAARYAPAFATFRMLALLILAGYAAGALLSRARRSAEVGGSGGRAAFLLPIIMSLDNLVMGTPAAAVSVPACLVVTAAVSASMAFAGLAVGRIIQSRLRSTSRLKD